MFYFHRLIPDMRIVITLLAVLLASFFNTTMHAQYAFELKLDYAMRVGNTDKYAVSGSLLKGRIEEGKTYFSETSQQFKVTNIISAKTGTTVPVASAGEKVSCSFICKEYEPERGETIRAVTTSPTYSGNSIRYHDKKLPEGTLSCKINGMKYLSTTVSKPVLVKDANVLDMFFEGEDKSVFWLQLNEVTEIKDVPHHAKSDTANHDAMYVCKVAFMPNGFTPTDLPNNYRAFEDFNGNAAIMVTFINKYEHKITFEFNGVLRPNARMLEIKPDAGLFYITEGRVDDIRWDNF
jgi:hypothetical protein